MARIKIDSLVKGANNYLVHIVLVEDRDGPEGPVEVSLGEATLNMQKPVTKAEAKERIINAAHAIMAEHEEAKLLREQLNQEIWPEIT